MNLTDKEILALTELANAVVDGTISDAQRDRLAKWLVDSEAARRFYVRYLGMSASLFTYASELQSEAGVPDVRPANVLWPPAWFWAATSFAAAACVVLGLWLGLFKPRDNPAEKSLAEQEREESVARVSGTKDSQWKDGSLRPGDELRRGQHVELVGGFAEITFDSGAQVTLEGPASFDLNSPWDAVLRRGTLKANIPAEAGGFRIANASVEVVNLGTEFSMVADHNGATEVFALQGPVEAARRDASGREHEAITLDSKQARRFTKAGITEVTDRDKKFARFNRRVPLDRLAQPANYVHWPFDENAGSVAVAQMPGRSSGSADARLSSAGETFFNADRIVGRWGNALRFDGNLYAKASLPGISRRMAHTVAVWVRLPEDAANEAGSMVSWSLTGGSGHFVDIGVSGATTHGVPGALCTRIGRKFIVGSTSLRDGQWHHVAVVISPVPKSQVAFQLKQYVDGKLEAVSKKMGGNRWPSVPDKNGIGDDGEFVWFGQPPSPTESAKAHFRGDLDELYIVDRALTPSEIRQLMQQNKPASTGLEVASGDNVISVMKGVVAQ